MDTINQQYDSSMKDKKRSKSITSKDHDELPRRGVRFSGEQVIVHTATTNTNNSHHNNDDTWLSSNDYTGIQKSVFMTLDMMNLIKGLNGNTTKYSSVNSRGLEDYSTQDIGYLKKHVTMRRKQAIHAVLQQQLVQQSYHRRTIMHPQEEQYQQLEEPLRQGRITEAYNSYYDDLIDNMIEIRTIYENYTTLNVLNAIKTGRYDSIEALSVYVEDQN